MFKCFKERGFWWDVLVISLCLMFLIVLGHILLVGLTNLHTSGNLTNLEYLRNMFSENKSIIVLHCIAPVVMSMVLVHGDWS